MATIEQLKSEPWLTIVYDGDCPLCRSYITLLRLKASIGPVKLLNARGDRDLVTNFASAGLPLDEGMAAVYGTQLYYGGDAIAVLSQLSTRSNLSNRFSAALLQSPDRARLFYPIMKAVRATVLFVLRRGSLHSQVPVGNSRET